MRTDIFLKAVIEDETGCINLVVFENLFQEYRKQILQSQLLMVEGKLQVEGEVIHVIVNACYDFSRLLQTLTASRNEKSHSLALPDGNESISKEVTSPSNVRENPLEKPTYSTSWRLKGDFGAVIILFSF